MGLVPLGKSLPAPGGITGQAISHLEQNNLRLLLVDTVSRAIHKAKTVGSQHEELSYDLYKRCVGRDTAPTKI